MLLAVRAPMFDEHEFQDAARHLQSADEREGFQRSAISRAYYAAFLYARKTFREKHWIPRTGSGSDHGAVASRINEIDIQLGKDFWNLQQLRRDADSSEREFGNDKMAEDAQLAIDLADFIRGELKRLT